MKVKANPRKTRLVVTLKHKELILIHLALLDVVSASSNYSEKNKNLAVKMRSKLPLNIEDVV